MYGYNRITGVWFQTFINFAIEGVGGLIRLCKIPFSGGRSLLKYMLHVKSMWKLHCKMYSGRC